jgi:hypothetical protein
MGEELARGELGIGDVRVVGVRASPRAVERVATMSKKSKTGKTVRRDIGLSPAGQTITSIYGL